MTIAIANQLYFLLEFRLMFLKKQQFKYKSLILQV